MKTTVCKYILYAAYGFIYLMNITSCNKSDDKTATNSFTWSYGSSNYSANFNGAYLTGSLSSTPIIIGGTGTQLISPGTGPTISLASFNLNTYNLATAPNSIYYVDDLGNPSNAISGSVNITGYSNSLISGNFTATLVNNVVVSGNFSNVPVHP